MNEHQANVMIELLALLVGLAALGLAAAFNAPGYVLIVPLAAALMLIGVVS